MTWDVVYLPEAERDFADLNRTQQLLIRKAIEKVRQNPLPASEGGYGKLLGNRGGTQLTGYLKIKLLRAGLRIVYKLIRTETRMLIIVIGVREDSEVYQMARMRIDKNQL